MKSLKPTGTRSINCIRSLNITSARLLIRVGACLILVAFVVGIFYSGSFASSLFRPSAPPDTVASVGNFTLGISTILRKPLGEGFLPLPLPQASPETIQTFAADCTTPKTSFFLGETVCAQTNLVTESDRFVNWCVACPTIAYGGAGVTDITPNQSQNFLYTPTVTGAWKATIADPSDSSIIPTVFTVVSQTVPIATYAADCSTPKTLFSLGDQVCARAIGFDPAFNRRFSWVDPAGLTRSFVPITSDPQTNTYTLPTNPTDLIDIFVVDNRGTWKVNVVSSRGSQLASAPFQVQGATPRANLSLGKSIDGGSVASGANFTYTVAITNFGPNTAANVVFTDPQPLNASFFSATQIAGPTPAFSCTGADPVVCTRATLGAGEAAVLELTYTAGAAGSTITNIATVASDTTEVDSGDNTASSGRITVEGNGGTPPECTLECPNDITVATNTAGGANVTFGSADTFGNCGAVTTNHASGSFFPIGTTSVTASSATGGGSCTFNVTVIDVPSPTIVCPADRSAIAPAGQSEAVVSVGAPTTTGTGVVLSAARSDDRDDSDPYPIGVTTIVWTARDQFDREVNCTQRVTVTSVDAPTIACPSDKTFDAGGDCQKTLTAGEIGTPVTGGLNSVTTFRRSDDLPLIAAYPAGQTTITWTATNAIGSASCTQVITITASGDTTPPTLTIPADLNVTTAACSSLLDDELGVATATDNCSTVSITRTGVPSVACPIAGNPTRTCETFVFPVGTTDVTYRATDAAGNQTTGVQHVTVHENTPPTFTFVPGNLTFNTGPGATSCGTFVGDATLGTATVSDNCDTTVIRSGVPAGNIFPVGDTVITYTAKADLTVTRTQQVTVVDNTPPVVTAPGAVTLYTGAGATSCGVTVTDLNATFGSGSATDNCSGVGSVTRGGVPAGNVFPIGSTTLTYSATDAHGNTSSANQLVTVVDNTPPTISCPANVTVYLPLNSTATSTVVNYPAASASDNCGSVGITYSQNSGTVFPVGPTTVTVTATDTHNNSSSCQFTVTVLYDFTGFFSPVANAPTLNSVNAGRAIPVKFSLSGNKGLNIFAAGNPYSVSLNCNSNDPGVDVTETVTAGGSSLSFGGDQYNYVWKTESSWAGTCRQLVLTLNDGSVHVANFKFK